MKRTSLRRKAKSKSPNSKLKEKLWTAFSLYVRTRDKGVCYTCGAHKEIKETNAGHFKHNCLDFDEMNIHCQCIRCNHHLSGNLSIYAERLIADYGLEKFNDLCKRSKMALAGERYEDSWLEEKIAYYKAKVLEERLSTGISLT